MPTAAEIGTAFERARTAVLVTMGPDGRPRPVPICAVAAEDGESPMGLRIHTPIDEKPKSTDDPLALARVRDIAAQPDVVVLIDHWDEDWTRLWWIRIDGRAVILRPDDDAAGAERIAAIAALRTKYPQYAGHDLEARPIIRIVGLRASSWAAAGAG
jgi:PPOX class probable F420-dependent enzyme